MLPVKVEALAVSATRGGTRTARRLPERWSEGLGELIGHLVGDGWLTGTWRSAGTLSMQPGLRGRPRSHGNLRGVIDSGDHVDGLVTGEVRAPYGRLLGNWSATIVGNTIAGEIGADAPVAPANSALIYLGGC